MATPSSTSSIPPAPILLPKLAFSSSSFDLSADTDSTPNSETTTLTDRHDSLKESPRSSICSSRSTESSVPTSSKQSSHKRVRFQESVCWSYFDVEQHITTTPELEHKSSFLGRSWARFKSRNSSGDLGISSKTPSGLRNMQGKSNSADMLSKVSTTPSGRPVLTRRSSSSSSMAYSIQQRLRQSAGRRYDAAATHAIWRASAAKAKGDWDDLLSNPRSSRLYA